MFPKLAIFTSRKNTKLTSLFTFISKISNFISISDNGHYIETDKYNHLAHIHCITLNNHVPGQSEMF